MKKTLFIIAAAILLLLLLPVLLVIFILSLFSAKVRVWALYHVLLAKVRFENRNEPLPTPEPYGLVADKLSEIKAATLFKIFVHGDLRELIIDGDATEERLTEAWGGMLSEYYDKAGGKKSKRYLELQKKITKLSLRINHIHELCNQFEIEYDDSFKSILKGYGYNFPFTVQSYLNDIRRIRTYEKRYVSMHAQLVGELDKEFKRTESKQTENDYYNIVETLREHGKYQEDAITLANKWTGETYAFLLARYNEHQSKLIEAKKQKR